MAKKVPFNLYIGTTAELAAEPVADGKARADTDKQELSVDNIGGAAFKVGNGALKEVAHDTTLAGKGTESDPLKVVGGGSGTDDGKATIVSAMVNNTMPPIFDISANKVSGTVKRVYADEAGFTGAKLVVTGNNLLDMRGVPTTADFVSNQIHIECDPAQNRIRFWGNATSLPAGQSMRMKLTNTFAFDTSTSMPTAWKDERVSWSSLRIAYGLIVESMTGDATMDYWFSVLYSDGTTLKITIQEAQRMYFEKIIPTDKTVAAILLNSLARRVFDVTSRLYVTSTPLGSAENFEPYSEQMINLPDTAANEISTLSQAVSVPRFGTAWLTGTTKPYKVDIEYRNSKTIPLQPKKYNIPVPNYPIDSSTATFITAAALNAMTYDGVYTLYETLRTANPTYITRQKIGATFAGKDIYEYILKPLKTANFANRSGIYATQTIDIGQPLPKVLLVGGIHSDERSSWYGLYEFIRQITSNWQNNEALEVLRHNVEIHVVPLSASSLARKNENNVNINRNFYPDWTYSKSTETVDNLAGANPLSEPEAKALYAFLANNTNADFYFDCHNFYNGTQPMFQIFLTSNSGMGSSYDELQTMIQKIAAVTDETVFRKWQKQYPTELPASATANTKVCVQLSSATSSSLAQSAALGIPGMTIETRWRFDEKTGSVDFDEAAQRMSYDHIANQVLAVLKYIC